MKSWVKETFSTKPTALLSAMQSLSVKAAYAILEELSFLDNGSAIIRVLGKGYISAAHTLAPLRDP